MRLSSGRWVRRRRSRLSSEPATADVQREKRWLTGTAAEARRVIWRSWSIHPDAVTPDAARREYGSYDLYCPANTDDASRRRSYDALREALVAARVRARNLDRAQVEAVMRVRRRRR